MNLLAVLLALAPVFVIFFDLTFKEWAIPVGVIPGSPELASVISPAKIQNASASIDRIGEEAHVIRTTFVISLIITGICALMALLWAL